MNVRKIKGKIGDDDNEEEEKDDKTTQPIVNQIPQGNIQQIPSYQRPFGQKTNLNPNPNQNPHAIRQHSGYLPQSSPAIGNFHPQTFGTSLIHFQPQLLEQAQSMQVNPFPHQWEGPRFKTETCEISQFKLKKINIPGSSQYTFQFSFEQGQQLEKQGYFKINEVKNDRNEVINYHGFGIRQLKQDKYLDYLKTEEFPILINDEPFDFKLSQGTNIRYYVLLTAKYPSKAQGIPTYFFKTEENIVNFLLYLRNKLKYLPSTYQFYQTFPLRDIFLVDKNPSDMNNYSFTVNMAEYIALSSVQRFNPSNSRTFNDKYRVIGECAKNLLNQHVGLESHQDYQNVLDIIDLCKADNLDSKLIDSLLRTYYVENPISQQKANNIISILQQQLIAEGQNDSDTQTNKVQRRF